MVMTCEVLKLDDNSRLIRHCPKKYFDSGIVSAKVFNLSDAELKEEDPYLSFNWLEKLCAAACVPNEYASAIKELEKANGFPRQIYKDRERWLFLSCERIKAALLKVPNCTPKICHRPEDDNQSHTGVSGYDKRDHELAATELWKELQPENIHNVTTSRKYKRNADCQATAV